MSENKTKFNPVKFIKKHYLIAASSLVLAGIISTVATGKKYSSVVKGTVLEEKYVHSGEKAMPKYMLQLKVDELTEKGTIERLCTFYVKEEPDMPIAALDEVISAGSTVYLHYYGSRIALHNADPIYPIGCFGTIPSTEIKSVHPWESSEVVKKSLEDHLEETRMQELERAKSDAEDNRWGLILYEM